MKENYLSYNTYLPTLWINVHMIPEYSTFWKLALKLNVHWPFNEKLSEFNDLASNTVANKFRQFFRNMIFQFLYSDKSDIVDKRNQK